MPGATVSRTEGENADQSSERATQSQSANPKRTAKTRVRWMWAELRGRGSRPWCEQRNEWETGL
jgi:hypothetical protein